MSNLQNLISTQPELAFLPKLLELAHKLLGPVTVILFGSRSRKDYHRRSDVDILIETSNSDDRAWAQLVAEIEDLPTLLHIDLVRSNEAEASLLSIARHEGIKIHE